MAARDLALTLGPEEERVFLYEKAIVQADSGI
jgi:hypothetical protein